MSQKQKIEPKKRKEKILKTGGKRYEIVVLYKNKKPKTFPIHKLVAEYFLENPNNYYCVNHKDGNKLNNNIENLEWCTISENTKHAYDLGLKKAVNRYTKNKCNQLVVLREFIKILLLVSIK